jgi:hypothetical protein
MLREEPGLGESSLSDGPDNKRLFFCISEKLGVVSVRDSYVQAELSHLLLIRALQKIFRSSFALRKSRTKDDGRKPLSLSCENIGLIALLYLCIAALFLNVLSFLRKPNRA